MLHGFSCTFSFCSPTVTYFNHRSIPNAMPHFYPRFLHCDGYLCESLLQSGLGIGGRAAIQRPMLLSAPPSPWGPSHHHFFLGVISYKFFEIHLLDWGPKSRSSKVFTPNIVLTTVGPSAHGQKKSHPTKSQLDDCTTLYSYSWSLDFVDLLLQIIVLGNGFQQLFLKRLQLFVLGMT